MASNEAGEAESGSGLQRDLAKDISAFSKTAQYV
jgi:hypothetical protein